MTAPNASLHPGTDAPRIAPGRRLPGDQRSDERIHAHYVIETALAARLRAADAAARTRLYGALYDELFRRVPDHPQLTQKSSPGARDDAVRRQLALFGRYLRPDSVFMEIGPGDCAVSFAVARRVRRVWGVDVSAEITRHTDVPANFTLVLSDGASIDVPPGSVDIVYSNQLMEHLHPDDAARQLRGVAKAIAPGGVYVCVTPSALSGPHDVSRHYDDVATGLHLREYTCGELVTMLRAAGFDRFHAYAGGRGRFLRVPLAVILAAERIMRGLPVTLARAIGRSVVGLALFGVRIAAFRASER